MLSYAVNHGDYLFRYVWWRSLKHTETMKPGWCDLKVHKDKEEEDLSSPEGTIKVNSGVPISKAQNRAGCTHMIIYNKTILMGFVKNSGHHVDTVSCNSLS